MGAFSVPSAHGACAAHLLGRSLWLVMRGAVLGIAPLTYARGTYPREGCIYAGQSEGADAISQRIDPTVVPKTSGKQSFRT